MENYKLVLPEHLNQYGYLYGGDLVKWSDEYAWIAASLDYPKCNLVTIGINDVEFNKSIRLGSILRFLIRKAVRGNTSVQYSIQVFHENENSDELVFSAAITFVHIDNNGKKKALPGEE